MTAIKHDSEKPRVELAMGPGFVEVAKAFTYGATKYEDFNYLRGSGLDWLRLAGAAGRHLAAWVRGEDLDQESQLNHLAHAGASIMMLLDLILRGKGKDGRYAEPSRVERSYFPAQPDLLPESDYEQICTACSGPLRSPTEQFLGDCMACREEFRARQTSALRSLFADSWGAP